MSDMETVVVRGKVNFFKFLGDPRPNYDKTGNEWTTDLFDLDPDDIKKLKKLGLNDRIKNKGDAYLDGEDFITLKQKELTTAGKPNRRVSIVMADGKTPWPEDKLLGNETLVDAKFVVKDNGKGFKKSVWPRSFRVLDHVPYAGVQADEWAVDADDEYAAKQTAQMASSAKAREDDLDDDLD